MKKKLMLEQHIHGAYGVDFNSCSVDDLIFLAEKLYQHNIGAFFPNMVTDSFENLKRQIRIIKEAASVCPRIVGIHLEGVFINPLKKGIHDTTHFKSLTVENYKLIEDDFIKIVTLAPELDEGLVEYLREKNVKVQAGHCVGWGNVDGVTHTYNAMSEISHRGISTALMALIQDNAYAEVIADGVHVSDEALKLFLKSKPIDKVLLVSDALPITNSDKKEVLFAGSKVYYDGEKATSKEGTIAGSTMLLDQIVERLKSLGLFSQEFIENPWRYHGLDSSKFV